MLQFFRPRNVLSGPVNKKFTRTLDHRNMLAFALTVRRLWKPCTLPKHRAHWCSSAKRRWTTFPPGILCDCFGSPDILGYVGMKSTMRSQGTELFTSLPGRNRPWGSLGRIEEKNTKRWNDNQHKAMWWGSYQYTGTSSKIDLGPYSDC
jgi:hypothetical protein